MSEQRSDEWFSQRLGKFTASDIHELLSDGTRDMTDLELVEWKKLNPKSKATKTSCIGQGLYTLAFKKACEIVFGRDESWNVESWDMKRGVALEPYAFELFKRKMAYEFIDVNTCEFIPFGANAGASPDGIVDVNDPLEIKCPRPEKFFKLIKDGLAAIDPEYISQMQHQMLCTGGSEAHFFNYCYYKQIDMTHHIIVPRNESIIGKIEDRICDAAIERDKFVEQLMNNKQF